MIKTYNKLVRDKIPEIIEANGDSAIIEKYIDDQDFKMALIDKLVEEAEELRAAKDEKEIFGELADIVEVLYALFDSYTEYRGVIEKYRQDKFEKNGGFNKRIKLISTDDFKPCICDKKDCRIITVYSKDLNEWVRIPFPYLEPGQAFCIYDGEERYVDPKNDCNVWIAAEKPFVNKDGIWTVMTSY